MERADDTHPPFSLFRVSCARAFRAPVTARLFEDWLADDVFHMLLNRRLQKRAIE